MGLDIVQSHCILKKRPNQLLVHGISYDLLIFLQLQIILGNICCQLSDFSVKHHAKYQPEPK